jgi:hypothetical protein
MTALAAALFSAALALVGKIGFDIWARHRERRGIAGALAGEIGAYVKSIKPSETAKNLLTVANLDRETRCRRLAATFGSLPNTHPIFDKVAGNLGVLPVHAVCQISEFYNFVTGYRLQLTALSSDKFLNTDDVYQFNMLNVLANLIKQHAEPTHELINDLEKISTQCFVKTLRFRCTK